MFRVLTVTEHEFLLQVSPNLYPNLTDKRCFAVVIKVLTTTQDGSKRGTKKPVFISFSEMKKGSRQLISKACYIKQGKRDSNPMNGFGDCDPWFKIAHK